MPNKLNKKFVLKKLFILALFTLQVIGILDISSPSQATNFCDTICDSAWPPGSPPLCNLHICPTDGTQRPGQCVTGITETCPSQCSSACCKVNCSPTSSSSSSSSSSSGGSTGNTCPLGFPNLCPPTTILSATRVCCATPCCSDNTAKCQCINDGSRCITSFENPCPDCYPGYPNRCPTSGPSINRCCPGACCPSNSSLCIGDPTCSSSSSSSSSSGGSPTYACCNGGTCSLKTVPNCQGGGGISLSPTNSCDPNPCACNRRIEFASTGNDSADLITLKKACGSLPCLNNVNDENIKCQLNGSPTLNSGVYGGLCSCLPLCTLEGGSPSRSCNSINCTDYYQATQGVDASCQFNKETKTCKCCKKLGLLEDGCKVFCEATTYPSSSNCNTGACSREDQSCSYDQLNNNCTCCPSNDPNNTYCPFCWNVKLPNNDTSQSLPDCRRNDTTPPVYEACDNLCKKGDCTGALNTTCSYDAANNRCACIQSYCDTLTGILGVTCTPRAGCNSCVICGPTFNKKCYCSQCPKCTDKIARPTVPCSHRTCPNSQNCTDDLLTLTSCKCQ